MEKTGHRPQGRINCSARRLGASVGGLREAAAIGLDLARVAAECDDCLGFPVPLPKEKP